jgi:threonine aldolase
MAKRLERGLAALSGVQLLAPVEANGVFADLPRHAIEALRSKGWRFYTFVGETGVRLMCAWDTPAEAVDAFVADLRTVLSVAPANGLTRGAPTAGS